MFVKKLSIFKDENSGICQETFPAGVSPAEKLQMDTLESFMK
jgi:hypothetical protein